MSDYTDMTTERGRAVLYLFFSRLLYAIALMQLVSMGVGIGIGWLLWN